ncbi:hypothetical protein [Leifsonia sp. Leaf264]|uniref:hypothetical protein n=1 Tax=Leifsonia sp. Leaf264 TaxID=1736314 RepID=UPI0007009E69|nr:hypothetical protein [Leifsonia sp. Leaf264]KQO99701.1 hypothetical protein ASF30_07290 [Leifsonia sp. Leaf264]
MLILDRTAYELEYDDDFDAPDLDAASWLPHYLPQWSSRESSRARYSDGVHFHIDGRHVKSVESSPAYPMQLMLDVYRFPDDGSTTSEDGASVDPPDFSPVFVVDRVSGYRML